MYFLICHLQQKGGVAKGSCKLTEVLCESVVLGSRSWGLRGEKFDRIMFSERGFEVSEHGFESLLCCLCDLGQVT